MKCEICGLPVIFMVHSSTLYHIVEIDGKVCGTEEGSDFNGFHFPSCYISTEELRKQVEKVYYNLSDD